MSQVPITRVLTADLTVETQYGKNVLSLFLVVAFAALGGFLTM